MSIRLILAGGGDAPESLEVDDYYRSILGPNPSIGFLPQAVVIPGIWTLDQAEAWLADRPALAEVSIRTVMDTSSFSEGLDEVGSVFIMGGNTFSLLDWLRREGHLPYLRRCIATGTHVVYGCSAGAILMGRTIAPAALGRERDENVVGLRDLAGLDLLCGASVFCHYSPDDYGDIAALACESGESVLCIPEDGGVFWNGRVLTNIGRSAITIVRSDGSQQTIACGGVNVL